jgi:hypothetical protein
METDLPPRAARVVGLGAALLVLAATVIGGDGFFAVEEALNSIDRDEDSPPYHDVT